MINKLTILKKFWKNKKVFLTGHTGFKGGWLAIFLNLLGAKVSGYSLKPHKSLSLYKLANLDNEIHSSTFADIRDYKKLKKSIIKFSPDFVIHMAAQPLVRFSYNQPKLTHDVNIMGTVNILNILLEINFVKSALIVTSDKVYSEKNNKNFKENDRLGGLDPYSASKSCAEIITNSYNQSFFRKKNISVATARAGNVIGGGDFSDDRIIPDFFRSLQNKKKIILRYPNSIRPWQYILDPLYGYLLLLMKIHKKKIFSENSWNFGPKKSNNKSVITLINLINKEFNNSVEIIKQNTSNLNYHESKKLTLNSSKSKKILNWKARYNLKDSAKLISLWYKKFKEKKNILKVTQNQIINYFN